MKATKFASIFAVSALSAAISSTAFAAAHEEAETEAMATETTTTFSGNVAIDYTYTTQGSVGGATGLTAKTAVVHGPFSAEVGLGAGDDDGDLDLSVSKIKYDNGTFSFGQLTNIYNSALTTGTRGAKDQNFTGSEWGIADGFNQDIAAQYTNSEFGLTAQIGGYTGDGHTHNYKDDGEHESAAGGDGLYDYNDANSRGEKVDFSQINLQAAFEQAVDGVGTAKASAGYVSYLDHTASGKELVDGVNYNPESDTSETIGSGFYDDENATKSGGLGLIYLGFESEKLADIATVKGAYRVSTYDWDAVSETYTEVTFDADDEQVETGNESEVEGKGVPGMLAFAVDADVAGANLGLATTTILGFDVGDDSAITSLTEIALTGSYAVNESLSFNAGYTLNDLMVGKKSFTQASIDSDGDLYQHVGSDTDGIDDTVQALGDIEGEKYDTLSLGGSYVMGSYTFAAGYDATFKTTYTYAAADNYNVDDVKTKEETFTAVNASVAYAFEDGLTTTASYMLGDVEKDSDASTYKLSAAYKF